MSTRRPASPSPLAGHKYKRNKIGGSAWVHMGDKITEKHYYGQDHLRSAKIDAENKRIEHQEVLRWLSKGDPLSNYLDARKLYQEDTGKEFLESRAFNCWKDSNNSLLWLHGIAGCGKTVLSSTIIHAMKEYCRQSEIRTSLSYFFFDFNDSAERAPENMLGILIRDLCPLERQLPEPVRMLYNEYRLTTPPISMLLDAFASVSKDSGATYIIIDALDECGAGSRSNLWDIRQELLDIIRKISSSGSNNLHLLVSSRDSIDQLDETLSEIVKQPRLKAFNVPLDSSFVDVDITKLLDARLRSGSGVWKDIDESMREKVQGSLLQKGKGMFRLVACQLEQLEELLKLGTPTISDLERALHDLPSTVNDLYDGILERMPRKDRDFAILKWMAYSKRPLLLREIRELALMDRDGTHFSLGNMLAIGPARYILRTFSSLIKVNGDLGADHASVQFAHYTVMYFLSNPGSRFYINECEANMFIASSSLSYLRFYFQSSDDHGKVSQNCPAQRSLVEYTVTSWYEHASRAYRDRRGVQRAVENPFWLPNFSTLSWRFRFQDRSVLGISWSMLTYLAWAMRFQNIENITLRQGLSPRPNQNIISAWTECSKALLRNGSTYLSRQQYESELTEVACRGYEYILRWLLDCGVLAKPNISHYSLMEAVLSGRLDNLFEMLLGSRLTSHPANSWLEEARLEANIKLIIRLLVDNGVDINGRNGYGATPLHWAAGSGQKRAIKRLLDIEGVDVDAAKYLGDTPLGFAAGVDPPGDVSGTLGSNALQMASAAGNYNFVELLINALQMASAAGSYNCMELLINAGADVSDCDDRHTTPLQEACFSGETEVVEILLNHKADVNAQGGRWGSALRVACFIGRTEVVEILLNHNVDVNAQGGDALQEACYQGNTEVVEILLNHNVDVNAQGGDALQEACYQGNTEVVEILLNHNVDVNAQGGDALQEACYQGNTEVVEILLNHKADVNAQGGRWGSALRAACSRGKTEVVEILLNHNADVNAQGGRWGSALRAACSRGEDRSSRDTP